MRLTCRRSCDDLSSKDADDESRGRRIRTRVQVQRTSVTRRFMTWVGESDCRLCLLLMLDGDLMFLPLDR